MSEVTRRSALTAAGFVVVGGAAGFVVARNSDAANEESQGLANAYAPPPKTGRSSTPAQPSGSGSAGASGSATTPATPTSAPLIDVAAVPSGGGVILKKKSVVITREDSGTVHAFTVTCPHQGCIVYRVKAGTIDCPCHGSKFDIATGNVVAGPAPTGLTPIPVTVVGGKVYPA